MGDIVKFKSKNQNVIDFMKEFIEIAETEGIDNVMVACKLKQKDATVMTGYSNLAMAEKQELLGHIQLDIINEMIKQNYVTP